MKTKTLCPAATLFGTAMLAGMFVTVSGCSEQPPPSAGLAVKTVENSDTLPCQIPASDLGKNSQQADFDNYSWEVFIALNRPASAKERGEPNCKLPYSAGTKVWQTYKTSDTVFLKNAQPPGPWGAGYPAVDKKTDVTQVAKASNASITRMEQESGQSPLRNHREAVGGWLIDQNKNPTYFQMFVNETWYNAVVSEGLYNRDNFSNQSRVALPNQSMEIKAAWRILTPDDKHHRYITQASDVVEFDEKGEPILISKEGEPPEYKTKPVTLGLVGFHQIIKAPGFPQWIWATFEHIDNVPDAVYDKKTQSVKQQPEAGVSYSYYNRRATADEVNQSPCSNGDPHQCLPFTTPNPLTRVTPVRETAKTANVHYQKALSTLTYPALKNYQLITTQWPAQPDNPGATNGMPTPTIAANTTMESYIQNSSNCMNCHGMATLPGTAVKSDYSFLFFEAQSASENTP